MQRSYRNRARSTHTGRRYQDETPVYNAPAPKYEEPAEEDDEDLDEDVEEVIVLTPEQQSIVDEKVAFCTKKIKVLKVCAPIWLSAISNLNAISIGR